MVHNSGLNEKGNIIVFAMSAIAVMSITAALLTTASLLEIKKSSNTERSVLARYHAETGIENAMFLLTRGFEADKSLQQIKTIFGFTDVNNFGEVVDCASVDQMLDDCKRVRLAFGVSTVKVDMEYNEAFTVNVFDPSDKDSLPFAPEAFSVNTIHIQWSDSAGNKQFEISLIPWRTVGGVIVPMDPIKRFLDDSTGEFDVLDGSDSNGIAVLRFPCDPPDNELCNGIGSAQGIAAKIRVRLIEPAAASGLVVQLYDNNNHVCNVGSNYPTQCLPGFAEVVSTGEARVGTKPVNRQALRVVSSLPGEEETGSVIWDYVIFSDQSLSK